MLTALTGCGLGAPGEAGARGRELRIATYNAGLTGGLVDYAAERAPYTAEALANAGAEVLCVQDYGSPLDVEALKQATAATLPNTPLQAATADGAACDIEDVTPLALCVARSCGAATNEALAECVLARCATSYGALPDACRICINANVGKSADEVRSACTSTDAAYSWGHNYGIGILTSAPILDHDFHPLDAIGAARGVLYAELDTSIGRVHTFCAQLTTALPRTPYPGDGSFAAEQARQIDDLRAYIDEKAGRSGAVILLGDMGAGPSVAGLEGLAAANYDQLAAGFTSANLSDPAGVACTYCADNPLAKDSEGSSFLLDHILLRGLDVDVGVERIMTAPLGIPVAGGTLKTAYSDHYGVSATLSRAAAD